jgi:hypothetical protein
MSQVDDSVKSDKIKALALAKECYAMKLELLTNATVVNDAIRFVPSHTTAQKNEENSDIQGSEENRSYKQQSTATTNNSIF